MGGIYRYRGDPWLTYVPPTIALPVPERQPQVTTTCAPQTIALSYSSGRQKEKERPCTVGVS